MSQPRDYLTREERKQVRESALEYGSVPGYSNLSPPERDRWRAYLAQRFEKPKEDVEVADWDRANGYKIPSLVWTSLDTGLNVERVGNVARQHLLSAGRRLPDAIRSMTPDGDEVSTEVELNE